MTVKNISTRAKICGRSAKCKGGHSAVEQQKYNAGGSFETTIGKTQYEVVMNFKEDGMSMQEKALRAVKENSGRKINSE